MKTAIHAFWVLVVLVLVAGSSDAQTVVKEPTIDGTLDVIEDLDVNQDVLWQVFVRPYDRKGDKVNLEIQLLNPARRNDFALFYNSNREAKTEQEAVYSEVVFNEAGVATVGPIGGEEMQVDYQEYFKANFAEPGAYAYKLVLRRSDGNILASVDETANVGTVAGIDDMIGDTRVAVYPTVSDGMVRVDLGSIRNATVAVTDLLGRRVLEMNSANGVVEISTRGYAKGAYLVKVLAEEGVASSRLIVR